MKGRPGQQAAAETEPQRSVCRSKAMKQHNALILPDVHDVITDKSVQNMVKSHLKGMAAARQPRLWGNSGHNRK